MCKCSDLGKKIEELGKIVKEQDKKLQWIEMTLLGIIQGDGEKGVEFEMDWDIED